MERRHIFLLCILTLLGVASCEKFFDRAPEDKFDSSKFFQSESDLVMYANGLINTGMPGAESITEGEDLYTDLCGTRASKDFYYQDMWNPGRQSGWAYSNWGFLRQIAFMLENMPRVKGKISDLQ